MGFLYSQFFVTPPLPSTALTGQTIIITGSNTGLGFAAAKHIAALKPTRLILAVRTVSKGTKAHDEIVKSTGIATSAVEVWQLDMSSHSSVISFADRCTKDLDRLDGISLNAGIQTTTFELMEGYESTLTVNVISTFLLAILLLPKLHESAQKFDLQPRLSIVSSETHAWASFPEKTTPAGQDILRTMTENMKAKGVGQGRYMDSKLIQILVFRHLQKLLSQRKEDGSVIWNILNPGFCYSDLGRDGNAMQAVMRFFLARSQEMGGRPIASGVIDGKETDGKYLHDGVIDEGALSTYVRSKEGEAMGERLWLELKVIFEQVRPGVTSGL